MSGLALVFLLLDAPVATPRPSHANACAGKGSVVHVKTSARELFLCLHGRVAERLPVALGSGGVGKKREGDAKVPLGRYSLATARSSAKFHLFLLIGYPTPAQQREGYTGSAVGVHGPPRGWEDEKTSVQYDWTLGCIAVPTDADIERVAAWTDKHDVRSIVIER